MAALSIAIREYENFISNWGVERMNLWKCFQGLRKSLLFALVTWTEAHSIVEVMKENGLRLLKTT